MFSYIFSAPLYMSPVQTECLNLDYYIPQNQENENTKKFSDQRWERIRKFYYSLYYLSDSGY